MSQPKILSLVGTPNSGKTTLYNWLTRSRFKTVNYPGATVDYSIGAMNPILADDWDVVDTPGVYSLHPKSTDEEVTFKVIQEGIEGHVTDAVVIVVDGTQFSRHLLLAAELKSLQIPFVIAVTMADLLKQNHEVIDIDKVAQYFGAPVVLINGLKGEGLQELVAAVKSLNLSQERNKNFDFKNEDLAKTLAKLKKDTATFIKRTREAVRSANAIDKWALHPILGPLILFAIMFVIFSSVYWVAAPFMDIIDFSFNSLADFVEPLFPSVLLGEFLARALILGIGGVVIFAPQIFILFFGISILESSGYLARAAAMLDKPLSKIGLSGRSFISLLSGHACAIPAIMAARNLSSKRDRMITQFIVPLLSCSARLPVYGLLLTFLFEGEAAWKAGFMLTVIYFVSIVVSAIAAAVMNKIFSQQDASFLLIELPVYRRPRLWVLIISAWDRTKSFVKRAGPVIFVLSIIMWTTTVFPNYSEQDKNLRTQTSYAASAGKVLEPIMRPMGADWRVGYGLIAAFAAREVFVSALTVMFNITADDEDAQANSLRQVMHEAKNERGETIFTPSSCVGLIIFFMIALQCMSTVTIYRKESGSLKLTIIQLVSFNLIAYALAVTAVQGLRFLGVA